MGTSTPKFINGILRRVMFKQPKRILDIGIGFGKWGFLCREYLDVWHSRIYPKSWKATIDGIEIYKDYLTPIHDYVYSNVYVGDACNIIDSLNHYDIIMANDVIEHIEKEVAFELLRKIKQKSELAICSIPLGKNWLGRPKRVTDINPYEDHISAWSEHELNSVGFIKSDEAKEPRGPIGLFVCG